MWVRRGVQPSSAKTKLFPSGFRYLVKLACWSQWLLFLVTSLLFTPLCGAAPRGFGLCLVPGLLILTALHRRKRSGHSAETDREDFVRMLIHMSLFALLLGFLGIVSTVP